MLPVSSLAPPIIQTRSSKKTTFVSVPPNTVHLATEISARISSITTNPIPCYNHIHTGKKCINSYNHIHWPYPSTITR